QLEARGQPAGVDHEVVALGAADRDRLALAHDTLLDDLAALNHADAQDLGPRGPDVHGLHGHGHGAGASRRSRRLLSVPHALVLAHRSLPARSAGPNARLRARANSTATDECAREKFRMPCMQSPDA